VRPSLRILATLLLAATTVILAAGPVAAHTGFDSSDPEDGSTVDQPIDVITLVFTGEAEPTGDGFRILDPTGAVRRPTHVTSTDGSTWTLRFDPALAGGTVGVRWTVKGPDTHPMDGSFSFTVTAPSPAGEEQEGKVGADSGAAPSAADDAPGGSATQTGVGLDTFLATDDSPTVAAQRVGAAARVVTVIGTLIGVGALIFAAAVLRGHHRDVSHVAGARHQWSGGLTSVA